MIIKKYCLQEKTSHKTDSPTKRNKKNLLRDPGKPKKILDEVYDQNIFQKVESYLQTIDPEQLERERAQHREDYLKESPVYKQFGNLKTLEPCIEYEYKKRKAREMGLIPE